jgi:8-oxo-dGTP diphosphatase
MSASGGTVRVAAAVIRRGATLLLTQRPPGGPLGLMWEFPGGKIEAGESIAHALAREIREELGVGARPGMELEIARFRYPHGLEVEIHFVECDIDSDELRPGHGVNALRWIRPAEVNPAEVLEADRPFLARLAKSA